MTEQGIKTATGFEVRLYSNLCGRTKISLESMVLHFILWEMEVMKARSSGL